MTSTTDASAIQRVKVAVTGASGFIGQRLCATLAKKGYDVHGLVSPGGNDAYLQSIGLKIVRGQLRDGEVMNRLMEGAQIVFHLAGITGRVFRLDSDYWDVNVTATKELLKTATEKGVRRLVYCSTADLCASVTGPPADEDTPLKADDIYQITKERGEEAALAANGKRGLEVAIVRPSKVYGPGDMRTLGLFKKICKGKVTIYGGGENLIHLVYIDDLVEGLILAAESPKSPGRVYIIGGDKCLTVNRMAEAIAEAAQVELTKRHLPGIFAKAYSCFCERLFTLFRVEPPESRRYFNMFAKSHCYSIDRAVNELGYSPKVSLEEGAARTIDWYKARGLI